MEVKTAIRSAAVKLAPKIVKLNLAFNPISREDTHALLSMSRDQEVVATVAIVTPYPPVQEAIFKRYSSFLGICGSSYNDILLCLANNKNKSERIKRSIADIIKNSDEEYVKRLHRDEMSFALMLVDCRMHNNSRYAGFFGITEIIAADRNMSPAVHLEIIDSMEFFIRKYGVHIYKADILDASSGLKKGYYSALGARIHDVLDALCRNTSLNSYCTEELAILKAEFDAAIIGKRRDV
ncbi:MAG: hypothetical protein M1156_00770 [Candidatus Marsarchaeota archaeon]|jgi:hypothetical protein|nr:hypothetical protein [Candidatus Marsarchaeota archaeon]